MEYNVSDFDFAITLSAEAHELQFQKENLSNQLS
jgi:hypothetical protein